MDRKMHKMEWYLDNNDFEGAKERFETTSPSWKSRWFEICMTIYNRCKELANVYFLNPINKTITKIAQVVGKRRSKYDDFIQINADLAKDYDKGKEKCYLFTFYNDKNEMVCSKIGTTTREVRKRLVEELKSKTYKEMGCVRAVINRVYDCGELPAEGLESYFRAMYIKQFPNSFKKNDRFMDTFFDLKKADEIALAYLG
jgi:hypothetical protein